ncbi:MAG TPA: hypothetical protein VNL13_01675 [Sulfolobales archaeon]|nr:hypothetical protein [Sulfolobales archaeon]
MESWKRYSWIAMLFRIVTYTVILLAGLSLLLPGVIMWVQIGEPWVWNIIAGVILIVASAYLIASGEWKRPPSSPGEVLVGGILLYVSLAGGIILVTALLLRGSVIPGITGVLLLVAQTVLFTLIGRLVYTQLRRRISG